MLGENIDHIAQFLDRMLHNIGIEYFRLTMAGIRCPVRPNNLIVLSNVGIFQCLIQRKHRRLIIRPALIILKPPILIGVIVTRLGEGYQILNVIDPMRLKRLQAVHHKLPIVLARLFKVTGNVHSRQRERTLSP